MFDPPSLVMITPRDDPCVLEGGGSCECAHAHASMRVRAPEPFWHQRPRVVRGRSVTPKINALAILTARVRERGI